MKPVADTWCPYRLRARLIPFGDPHLMDGASLQEGRLRLDPSTEQLVEGFICCLMPWVD